MRSSRREHPDEAASEPAAPPPSDAPAAVDPTPTSTTRRDVGFAIGALGLVGISVGTGYGVWALAKKEDYQTRWPGGVCAPETCAAAAEDAKHALERTSILSTLGFGVGAVGLVTGLYLVLTAPSWKTAPQQRAHRSRVGEIDGRGNRREFLTPHGYFRDERAQ